MSMKARSTRAFSLSWPGLPEGRQMRTIYRPAVAFLAAAFAGGLLLVLPSCGDGGYESRSATPTPTAAAESVLDLSRFHYAATLTLRSTNADGGPNEIVVATEGDFQAPDRHAFTYRTQLRGVTIAESAVVIGDKVWLRSADGPWREAAPNEPQATELFSVAFSPIRPGFLGGPDFRRAQESVRRLPTTQEFINEVRAYHYGVGAEGQAYFQSFLAHEQFLQQVQDASWEIWLAKDGAWPVRLLASGTVTADLQILQELDLKAPTHWELRIDISRPNDPELVVAAPAP